jgi:hypothetical protein
MGEYLGIPEPVRVSVKDHQVTGIGAATIHVGPGLRQSFY